MDWQPINTAPIDGRPVWVRGWDWGKPDTTRHHTWAYWYGDRWTEANSERGELCYLTEWMPLPPTNAGGDK